MSSWTQFRDAPTPPGTSITFPAPAKACFGAGGTERQSPPGPCGYRQETPAPFPNIPQGFTSRGVDTKPLPRYFPPARALAAPCAFHTCCVLFGTARGSPLNPHLGSPWGESIADLLGTAPRRCWGSGLLPVSPAAASPGAGSQQEGDVRAPKVKVSPSGKQAKIDLPGEPAGSPAERQHHRPHL